MGQRNDRGDWEFTGLIEAVTWGRSVYTVIRIPPGLAADAKSAGTRRIEGTIDDIAVNLAVTRAPVLEHPFVWAGRSLLRRLGADAGAVVECRLRPVDDDVVPVPPEVATRLADAGMLRRWESLPPAERRRRLYPIESAGRLETRTRRIDELIDQVGGGDWSE